MGKESVLRALEQGEGGYVSGEELSARLGISRAAVWKSIRALRADGYTIEARSARGYRLCAAPDVLTGQEIRRHLGQTAVVGGKLVCFASIDSTNTYLKTLAAAPDGMVAVAQEQTAGRGRRGRRFESPAGGGVYLSALLRPQLEAEQLLPVTGLCAVSACSAIERVTGVRPQIKWTNDLILGGKKLAGILTELSLEGESGAVQYVILGVGINVCDTGSFTAEVEEKATSLAAALGHSVSRAALAAALIEELDKMYLALQRGEIAPYLAAYRRDCVTIGAQVQLLWQDVNERVTALDVDDQLGLIVRREDGRVETIRTGEVSVRGLYGYVG